MKLCAKKNIALLFFVCFTVLASSQEFRSIDGFGNNVNNPTLGMTNGDIARLSPANYADGISIMNDEGKANPRTISNIVFAQDTEILDNYSLSDFVWVFGQFIDHDVSSVEGGMEPAFITVPEGDEVFTPGSIIPMARSLPKPGTGTDITNPRNYENGITSFIDGSSIYGSTLEVANALRSFEDGKLRVSSGNLLPWNTTTGEFNDPVDHSTVEMADDTGSADKLFLAGDFRANENVLLTCMHTLFVREHNRICDELVAENPAWDDERIYQLARKEVGAYFQSIVYNEWLPAMGINLPEYQGYDANVDPRVTNLFSAAAFRVGHTLINSKIVRMDDQGNELDLGEMTLKDAFFKPVQIPFSGGIEPFLKGMAQQVQQQMDSKVIDDVRNFLFGAPGAGGLDLAAININRGRERGLLDYNDLREWYGLPRFNDFSDLSSNPNVIDALSTVYQSVDQIDAWVGLLAEDHLNDAIFGELLMLILKDQFASIRDGDRFFYLNDDYFSEDKKDEISNTSIHDIVMRNCELSVMQTNLFQAMPHQFIPNGPELAPIELESVAYPNPVDTYTTIKIYSEDDGLVNLRLMDIKGQTILSMSQAVEAGNNLILLEMPDNQYNRGLYHLLIESNTAATTLKLFKD